MEKSVAVIDLKAFYAFVECVDRKLNPFTTPLAVCDASRGNGTIVLSVSPYLKSLGVPSRCRKRELPEMDGMIFATPRMSLYLEKSTEVVSIVLDYVGEDDIHIYSIDELFVNLGPYLKMYGMTPKQLTRKIQKSIYDKTKLVTTAGIAPNMFLAKAALDLDAKKRAPYISEWKKSDVEKKLWPVTPLSKMWGISQNYERRLNSLGIKTVGQLAAADKMFLKQQFGVIGEQIWEHANGIDNTNIRMKYISQETSLTLGQVLFRDYKVEEAKLIIREMNDDLCMRLREHKRKAGSVGLAVGYSMEEQGGFSKCLTLESPTDDTEIILKVLYQIYETNVLHLPIRRLHIFLGALTESEFEQLSMFEDTKTVAERRNLQIVVDRLKREYGKNVILRGSSLLEESTAKERHNQIGGHKR